MSAALTTIELMLVGAACGAVGVWVLHFGQAILSESFSHALLPGLVVATIVGSGLILGAVVGVVAAYLLLLLAARAPRTSSQSANSIAVTLLVAAGALIAAHRELPDFESLLFGDPSGTTGREVGAALGLAVVIAAGLIAFDRPFAALAFDRRAARALGVNPAVTSAAALALLAISVSTAATLTGTLMALALTTGPALGALAVTSRLHVAIWLSGFVGAVCGAVGLLLADALSWPTGACIALAICVWASVAPTVTAWRSRRPRLV